MHLNYAKTNLIEAIPFLFEIVKDGDHASKIDSTQLLMSIAIGCEDENLPFGFDLQFFRSELKDRLANISPSLLVNAVFGPHIDLEAYNSISKSASLFVDNMDADDLGVRVASMFAISWFPECVAGLKKLETAIQGNSRTNDIELANTLLAYGLMSFHSKSEVDANLVSPYLKSKNHVLRCCAAICLSRIEGNDDVVHELQLASEDDSLEDLFPNILFNDGNLQAYAVKVLEFLDE